MNLFDKEDISITNHGKYIQTAMRTMVDRKVSYKRIYLTRLPIEQAEPALEKFKQEWISKHNHIARKYNQIKKKSFSVTPVKRKRPYTLQFQKVSSIEHFGTDWSNQNSAQRKSLITHTLLKSQSLDA